MPDRFRGVSAGDLEGKVVSNIPKAGIGAITGRSGSMLQLAQALQRVLRVAVLACW